MNNTTSGIFMFYFSMGEMLGPILGSLLTVGTGSFVRGIAIVDVIMILWALFTFYHLAGFVLLKVKPITAVHEPLKESLTEEDHSPALDEKEARKKD